MIERHGKDAVALYAGNPTVHSLSASVMLPMSSRRSLEELLFRGDRRPDAEARVVRADVRKPHADPGSRRRPHGLPLDRRANPWVSNGSLATAPDFRDAFSDRHARRQVVVIDPRRTETAAGADEHLFVSPVSDAYFLLAIAHSCSRRARRPRRPRPHLAGVDEVKTLVDRFARRRWSTHPRRRGHDPAHRAASSQPLRLRAYTTA